MKAITTMHLTMDLQPEPQPDRRRCGPVPEVPEVDRVPVLIVGAGPAGLTAAVTLARHGIECLLVDRRPDLFAMPRATVVSTRSMELLRSWGLDDDVRDGG